MGIEQHYSRAGSERIREIVKKIEKRENRVSIPGSKSISHRTMICASLAEGRSRVENLLESEDINLTVSALAKMGSDIQKREDGAFEVTGFNGSPHPFEDPIYLGNSGTSMRLLTGIAALGNTPYILTGDKRMQERPMGDILNALEMAGISAEAEHGNDCPPVRIEGDTKKGGSVLLDCSRSSQYLSSLLMMGAVLEKGMVITLPSPAVSEPYVNLTMDIMKKFGVHSEKKSDLEYHVPGRQQYSPGEFTIEPDISNASYFWAAGAVTKKMIRVANITDQSLQGDLKLLDIFKQMGCTIEFDQRGAGVKGGDLKAVDVDMSDIPDVAPTLAVTAAFADGKTVIRNIGHLREKECDRIDAVVSQLNKMGITAEQGDTWMSVQGGTPAGALIETFNDHRMAMAFSVAGLKVSGVKIENPGCVAKSFPSFWEVFDKL